MGDNHHIGTLCVCVVCACVWQVRGPWFQCLWVTHPTFPFVLHIPPNNNNSPFSYNPPSHLTPTSRPAKGLESCHTYTRTHIHLRLVVYRLLLTGGRKKRSGNVKKLKKGMGCSSPKYVHVFVCVFYVKPKRPEFFLTFIQLFKKLVTCN